MSTGSVVVLGVPSAAGGRSAAPSHAPARLREAGLLDALGAKGIEVVSLPDLPPFPFAEDDAHPRARNTALAADAVRAIAEAMPRALAAGFTLLLGGDCSMVAGTVAGARRHLGVPVGLVFLDADADLNTPDTTPSGYLHGMALATALGRGPRDVVAAMGPPPYLDPEHVSLVGFRALDPGERAPLGQLGLALPAAAACQMGMTAAAALAHDGVGNGDGPVVVHLDVDVIDQDAGETLGPALVSDLLTRILASERVVALEVCEYDHGKDDSRLSFGGRIADIVSRAVARRLRG
jgi:arginase